MCYTESRAAMLAVAWQANRIDMLRRTIRVEEALTNVRGQLALGKPKSRASRRTVTMPKALVNELAEHMRRFPPSKDSFVFTAPSGGPVCVGHFRRRVWTPVVQKSVGEPLRFHDLRHTHVALLIAAGTHPKVIQARLGHASIRTTLDTYGHLFDGFDQSAADPLDEAMASRSVGMVRG